MRQTVGGAQSVATRCSASSTSVRRASNRAAARHEDGGPRVPGREERAPGVLGPSGRADVAVPVALAHADPVHRREVAHRVARVGVEDHLRPGGRAGGEIEEEGIPGARDAVGLEPGRLRFGVLPGQPAGRAAADEDADAVPGNGRERRDPGVVRDHAAHPSARDAVAEVGRGQQRRGRTDDGAELHGRQRDFPERRRVRQHDEDRGRPGTAPRGAETTRRGRTAPTAPRTSSARADRSPGRRTGLPARCRAPARRSSRGPS